MPRLSIQLFGTPVVTSDDHAIKTDRRKGIAILAYLAVTQQPQTRETLATLLWPDYERKAAFAYLRRALWTLNKSLLDGVLSSDRHAVTLAQQPDVVVDVLRFRALLAERDQHQHAEREVCARCLPLLVESAELYRGIFMVGFTMEDSPEFDRWQQYHADRLQQQFLEVLCALVAGYAAQGQYEAALPFAQRWLLQDGLDEEPHCWLMRLYAELGQREAALAQFARCQTILADELGVEPMPETVALHEAIAAGDHVLESPFWDIAAETPPPPHNLPPLLTAFIGRDDLLQAITDQLHQPHTRLITLLGQGGIGKTTVALALAHQERANYRDGVYFVDLVPIDSADFLVATIAEAMGILFRGSADPRTQLFDHLRDKSCLLILDNFEHILDKQRLVSDLILDAPHIDIVVTSRERLGVRAERAIDIDGLAYPQDAESGQAYPAGQLYLDRVRRMNAGYRPTEEEWLAIGRICQLVAGSPLAIELAAAWSRVLSPVEIAAEITTDLDQLRSDQPHLPVRHQSLHAVFNHSWQLLMAQEQQLFARLSVFRGDFDRHAAQAVAEISLHQLAMFVDKSLVQYPQQGRYRVPEILRQFAAAALADTSADQQATMARHADHYLSNLPRERQRIHGAEPQQAIKAIEAALGNIRSAWRWTIAKRAWETLDRAVGAISDYHELQGRYLEAVHLLQEAIDPLADDPTQALRYGWVLVHLGHHVTRLGDYERAIAQMKAAVALLETSANRERYAYALSQLGGGLSFQGAVEEAEAVLQQALDVLESAELTQQRAETLNYLGIVTAKKGDLDQARHYFETALSYAEQHHAQRRMGMITLNLGNVTGLAGEYEQCEQFFAQALAYSQASNDLYNIASVRIGSAELARRMGKFDMASAHFQAGLRQYRQMNYKYGIMLALEGLGCVHLDQEAHDTASIYLRECIDMALAAHATTQTLDALAFYAGIMAKSNPTAALPLLQLVADHPSTSADRRAFAQTQIDQLPPAPAQNKRPTVTLNNLAHFL